MFSAARSGTTVTFVIIDGWVVTVASVGDSRCILESAEGSVYFLSADHRLDANEEEVERVTTSGSEVGRINIAGGAGVVILRTISLRSLFTLVHSDAGQVDCVYQGCNFKDNFFAVIIHIGPLRCWPGGLCLSRSIEREPEKTWSPIVEIRYGGGTYRGICQEGVPEGKGGLFVYNIFWVFFTPVMVSVAKYFDAPIKLLFPTATPW
ncbi:uncharacterized protein LOC8086487 isoform X2 [Sorghum bicolor]|uniref:uncharacterized protein LOC8086487 isoform X2 n=1 Tax=Sorghum bicolor TaxID=4558 RepID=UPI000B425527|nr:uncharacterized protein LOC8086487 isoform X2 [Sorghum bicolor]|eukprot:XP_021318294.1 uncharacterized protein LOC8086487 isoform X2 [Sorghum bicolor]